MIIGHTNNFNDFLNSEIGEISNLTIISFFDNYKFDESELSSINHNVLIFPIIESYDEVNFSAIGWNCAIKSAFQGDYTVTSIFIVSPNDSLLHDCVSCIKQLSDDVIIDNIWLWPISANTPSRETDISKLKYQTMKSQQHEFLKN